MTGESERKVGALDWKIELGDAAAIRLPDKSVDLVFGSPPYMDARTYGIGAQRDCREWIEWMLKVTREACRVSRGLTIWIVGGVTRDKCYWPGCEGLLYEWWREGGACWRPAFWHRVGIPGSGGKQWLRADIEYAMALLDKPRDLPWANNVANGHPPKWAPGGAMSYRTRNGDRINLNDTETMDGDSPAPEAPTADCWGGKNSSGGSRRANGVLKKRFHAGARQHTKSRADGTDEIQGYIPPKLANPGNLVSIKVGGGLLGSDLAHENEAPFPVDLARWFIRGWCQPGGLVCDPFSGSGTTSHAAFLEGRNSHCFDIRQSQVDLGTKRMKQVTEGVMF